MVYRHQKFAFVHSIIGVLFNLNHSIGFECNVCNVLNGSDDTQPCIDKVENCFIIYAKSAHKV